VVPIGEIGNVSGIFLLGKKVNNEVYTKEDIDFLNQLRLNFTLFLITTITYKQAIERIKI